MVCRLVTFMVFFFYLINYTMAKFEFVPDFSPENLHLKNYVLFVFVFRNYFMKWSEEHDFIFVGRFLFLNHLSIQDKVKREEKSEVK